MRNNKSSNWLECSKPKMLYCGKRKWVDDLINLLVVSLWTAFISRWHEKPEVIQNRKSTCVLSIRKSTQRTLKPATFCLQDRCSSSNANYSSEHSVLRESALEWNTATNCSMDSTRRALSKKANSTAKEDPKDLLCHRNIDQHNTGFSLR